MSLRAFKKDEKQIKSWWLECILVETYPSDQIFHWSVPATESPHVIQPNNSVFHTQQNIGFVDGGAEMFKTHFLSNRNSTAMDNDTTRQNKLGRDLAKGHSSFPLYEDTNFGGRQSSATALAMNCPNNYKRQKRELKNRSIGLKKKKKKDCCGVQRDAIHLWQVTCQTTRPNTMEEKTNSRQVHPVYQVKDLAENVTCGQILWRSRSVPYNHRRCPRSGEKSSLVEGYGAPEQATPRLRESCTAAQCSCQPTNPAKGTAVEVPLDSPNNDFTVTKLCATHNSPELRTCHRARKIRGWGAL